MRHAISLAVGQSRQSRQSHGYTLRRGAQAQAQGRARQGQQGHGGFKDEASVPRPSHPVPHCHEPRAAPTATPCLAPPGPALARHAPIGLPCQRERFRVARRHQAEGCGAWPPGRLAAPYPQAAPPAPAPPPPAPPAPPRSSGRVQGHPRAARACPLGALGAGGGGRGRRGGGLGSELGRPESRAQKAHRPRLAPPLLLWPCPRALSVRPPKKKGEGGAEVGSQVFFGQGGAASEGVRRCAEEETGRETSSNHTGLHERCEVAAWRQCTE